QKPRSALPGNRPLPKLAPAQDRSDRPTNSGSSPAPAGSPDVPATIRELETRSPAASGYPAAKALPGAQPGRPPVAQDTRSPPAHQPQTPQLPGSRSFPTPAR